MNSGWGDCKNVVTQMTNMSGTPIESNRNFRNCERVLDMNVDECLHYKRHQITDVYNTLKSNLKTNVVFTCNGNIIPERDNFGNLNLICAENKEIYKIDYTNPCFKNFKIEYDKTKNIGTVICL